MKIYNNIKEIIESFNIIYNKKNTNKKLLDYEIERFGDFTLEEILNKYKIKHKIEYEDIKPSLIVGTSHHPNVCNKYSILLNNGFLNNILLNNINNDLYKIQWNSNESELMTFYSFNWIDDKKYYIVKHGNHRSILGYFLELQDSDFRLKNVMVTSYTIDWNCINLQINNKILYNLNKNNYIFTFLNILNFNKKLKNKVLNIIKNELYFDYKMLEKYIIS